MDTVEDDMTYFENNEVKIEKILEFCEKSFTDEHFQILGCGEADERVLLEVRNCRGSLSDSAGNTTIAREHVKLR